MAGLLVVLIAGMLGLTKWVASSEGTEDWRSAVQEELAGVQELAQDPTLTASEKEQLMGKRRCWSIGSPTISLRLTLIAGRASSWIPPASDP